MLEKLRNVIASILFICVVLLSVFFFSQSVHAQESPAGIQLIPATIDGTANPGQPITKTIKVTNINSDPVDLFVYVREVTSVKDGGTPVFADPSAEVTGYEITEWIELDQTELSLQPGQEVPVEVTIRVPLDATPGSHFGAVFVSAEPPKMREIGAGVGYEVASIISIRVSGDIIDESRIRSFSTDKLIYGEKKVSFLSRVENQGNILIRPRGPLVIENMFGQEVANIAVNDSQAGVFPGVTRDIEVVWDEEGFGFGQYTAVIALVYDGNNGQKTIDASTSFWILPTKIIVPVVLVLLVLVVVGYIVTRLYIKSVISRTAGSRVLARSRRRRKGGVSRLLFIVIVLLVSLSLFLLFLLILLS